ICPGSYPVKATIQNDGTVPIYTVTVNWSVDGVAQAPVRYTSLLDTAGATGSPTGLVTLGSYTFASSQSYDVKVWTSDPSGVADTVNSNDTAFTLLTLYHHPTGLSVSNVTATSAE